MNVRRWFKKLGIPIWAKLFVNLRASLIKDLLDKYQQYFVCKWLGNTPNVLDKFYRMITPEHVAVAAGQGDSKIANEIATKNGNENVNFSPELVTFHANMQSCQLNEKSHICMQHMALSLKTVTIVASRQGLEPTTILAGILKKLLNTTQKVTHAKTADSSE